MTACETTRRTRVRARLGTASKRFASDCSGATAIEYALIAGIIGAVGIAGASLASGAMNTIFARLSTAISGS